MIGVLTDTTASIPEKLARQLDIEIVPYYVHRGLETLRDMVDVKPREFARWLVQATRLPTTSNPSPGDYMIGLKRLTEQAKEIVALTMTSKGSGAYQSCLAAVDLFKIQCPEVRVEVVDTLQVAMSHGWAAIEAARAALAGLSLDGVVQRAREVAQKGMMLQTADTLRYLYMGGRIGRATHMVGTLLNIKPVIGMEEGVITPLGQARSRRQAYRKMVDIMADKVGLGARIKIGYVHAIALEEVEKLRRQVEPKFDCQESYVTELSMALGVHTGPGTVGLGFFPL